MMSEVVPDDCHQRGVAGAIPLNARYTRVEISNNFRTSDGLHPKDIFVGLRRAQAQQSLCKDCSYVIELLVHSRDNHRPSIRLP